MIGEKPSKREEIIGVIFVNGWKSEFFEICRDVSSP